jgi:DNA-binding MarR family transcriptional regulator
MEMNDNRIEEQARQLECVLPSLMRRLFTLDPEHPVSELPVAQMRVCIVLQNGPKPMSSVSEELGISMSATTQLADRLERAGLVERVAEPDDRRMKRLSLTAYGAELMDWRRRVRLARTQEMLTCLSEEERLEAIRVIRRLLEAAVASHPEPLHEDPSGARTRD